MQYNCPWSPFNFDNQCWRSFTLRPGLSRAVFDGLESYIDRFRNVQHDRTLLQNKMTNTLQIISAPQLSYILISWEPHWMNTEPGIPRVLNWCLKWMNILLAANAMSQAKLQRMSPTQTSIHLTCEDCGLHQKISDAKGNNRHLRVTANELRTWANSLVLVSSRKHTNLFFCPGSAAGAAALNKNCDLGDGSLLFYPHYLDWFAFLEPKTNRITNIFPIDSP